MGSGQSRALEKDLTLTIYFEIVENEISIFSFRHY